MYFIWNYAVFIILALKKLSEKYTLLLYILIGNITSRKLVTKKTPQLGKLTLLLLRQGSIITMITMRNMQFFDISACLDALNQRRSAAHKRKLAPHYNFGLRYLKPNYFQNLIDEYSSLYQTSHLFEPYSQEEMHHYGFDVARKYFQAAKIARQENNFHRAASLLKQVYALDFKKYLQSKEFHEHHHKALINPDTWEHFTTQNKRTLNLSLYELHAIRLQWFTHGKFSLHSSAALCRLAQEIIPALENHLYAAQRELIKKRATIPPEIAQPYQQWLGKMFSELRHEKYLIANAMLARLQVANALHDTSADDVTVAILHQLNEKVLDKPIHLIPGRRGLTRNAFHLFHQYIYTNGTQEMYEKLLQLTWFNNTTNTNPTDPFKSDGIPVVLRQQNSMPLILPAALADSIPIKSRWPRWLFRGDHFRMQFFINRQHLLANLKILPQANTKLALHNLRYYQPLRLINQQEALLQHELLELKQQREKISFFTDGFSAISNKLFLTKWENLLHNKQQHILASRLQVLQSIGDTIETLRNNNAKLGRPFVLQLDDKAKSQIETALLATIQTLSALSHQSEIYNDAVGKINIWLASVACHALFNLPRLQAALPHAYKNTLIIYPTDSRDDIKLLLQRLRHGQRLSNADTGFLTSILASLQFAPYGQETLATLTDEYLIPTANQVLTAIKDEVKHVNNKFMHATGLQTICHNFLYWGPLLRQILSVVDPHIISKTSVNLVQLEKIVAKFIISQYESIQFEIKNNLTGSSVLPLIEQTLREVGGDKFTACVNRLVQLRMEGNLAAYINNFTNLVAIQRAALMQQRYQKDANVLAKSLLELAMNDPNYKPFASEAVISAVHKTQECLIDMKTDDVSQFVKTNPDHLPEEMKPLLGLNLHDGLGFVTTALNLSTKVKLGQLKLNSLSQQSPSDELEATEAIIDNVKNGFLHIINTASVATEIAQETKSRDPQLLTDPMRDFLINRFGELRFFNKRFTLQNKCLSVSKPRKDESLTQIVVQPKIKLF